jgi:hypothetical protein
MPEAEVLEFTSTNPDTNGPSPVANSTAPENKVIGMFLSSAWYKSLITPPTIVKKTELPAPAQNLTVIIPEYDLVIAQQT